jgi:hypothetical protein
MKITILATSMATLLAGAAFAQNYNGLLTVQPDFSDGTVLPSLRLEWTDSSYNFLGANTLSYTEDTGFTNPLGIFTFEATRPDMQWQWLVPSRFPGDTGGVMRLRENGVLSLIDPTTGITGLDLNATGSITFGSGGTAKVLSLSNGQLRIAESPITAGSPIVTESSGDNRYLKIGNNRLQFGTGSQAQSDFSFAFGDGTRANGLGAVAMGASFYNGGSLVELCAVGTGATAFGYGSHANATAATAIGRWNNAAGPSTVVIGDYNDATAEGGVSLGKGNSVRAAYSTAAGLGNFVEATQATAFGWGNHIYSTGGGSTAMGVWNQVHGDLSVGIGFYNISDGYASVALGKECQATGWGSLAVGEFSKALNTTAVALGKSNTASGSSSFAVGYLTTASAEFSSTFGYQTTASGVASAALGVGTQAFGPNQFVVGSYNDPIVDPNGTPGNPNDAAFIVGNGTQTGTAPNLVTTRKNALVVRWNGNTEATGTIISQATAGYNKFKAPVLIPKTGDIDMGEFETGEAP